MTSEEPVLMMTSYPENENKIMNQNQITLNIIVD